MTFEEFGLKEEVLKAITELGYFQPTPVQEKAIPLLINGESDFVGLAQTGTGKTAAFGLPLLERVDISHKKTQAVILSPTRELALQIYNDLIDYSKYIKDINIVAVYGGASIENQIKQLRRGAHIIVATPGRLQDLINRKHARLEEMETLILDEADEMLNMGFREEIDGILENTPPDKITWLFSATMPKEVERISRNYMSDPVKITIGSQNSGAENVNHVYYMVHAKDRYLALKRIADYFPNIYGIVFCRTRQETKDVADQLMQDGYNADALHGDLTQAMRDQVMKKFRNRNLQMLIATDVAARGLDVDDLTHVINYNLPDDTEVYTHRSGRTGRAGKSGTSISIIHMREKGRIRAIERMIKKKFTRLQVPQGGEICEKQLFHLIDKLENVVIDHEEIHDFLPVVYKKLEWLSKEQLIQHFVSLEFNRFLDYYRDARDLNEGVNRNERNQRDRGNNDRDRRNKRSGRDEGLTTMFINVGSMDGLKPQNLIGLINDNMNARNLPIGKIRIMKSFTFFDFDEQSAKQLISSTKGVRYNDRKISIQIADRGGNRGGGNSGGSERRSDRRRRRR